MQRRDFVKNATLTAIGASLIAPIEAFGALRITNLESKDLSFLPKIKDDYALHFMAIGDMGRNGEYN